jgi:hypothetical protein
LERSNNNEDSKQKGSGVNKDTLAAVHKAAEEAAAAGLCIVPPAEDGSKRPWPNASGKWEHYKTTRPTSEELRRWYPGRSGLGIVMGPVSDNTECWDFDDALTYEEYVARAKECGLGPVVDRIVAGYCDRTPGDGIRWLVRRPDNVELDEKDRLVLARRPKREDEKRHPKDNTKTLIEIPRYAIVAPTNGLVHPSKKPYVRCSGTFATIESYTAEERQALIDLARSFDEMPRDRATSRASKGVSGGRPGDDYNSRTTWDDVLKPDGWTKVYTKGETTYWRRPGKRQLGISATTNYGGSDLLHVFSTATEFEPERSYDRFAACAVLECGGDFKAAAKRLAAEGYGEKKSASTSPQQSASADTELREDGGYRETESGIEWFRKTDEAEVWLPLTNFRARITADVTVDDDVERTKIVEIEATLRGRSHRFAVPAADFAALNWPIKHLGPQAIIHPGHGTKDRSRFAIQLLSGQILERSVYAHTGWRKIRGEWFFLSGSGALGANGMARDIDISLPEQLTRVAFPEINERTLADDVAASLALRSVAPDHATIPLLGAIYRSVIGGSDISVHISGRTGAQKTELAALAQQHFGPSMHARALPASWEATSNNLEIMASAAKDVITVIDDYVLPAGGTSVDRARLNAKADRVLRAQGNNSGRGRLRPDATMKPQRPPRGLIVSTGEEVPGGQSLIARMIIIELICGQVDQDKLTTAQIEAIGGVYAHAMAGYIRWLAPRLDEVRQEFKSLVQDRRSRLHADHKRSADAFAQISAAWIIWLRFVRETGAITKTEADAIEAEVWSTLASMAGQQNGLHLASDPVERFLSLLGGALSSGRGHICRSDQPDVRPTDHDVARALGWRRDSSSNWHPLGPCIGWVAEDGLYLEPEAAYAAAQQLGGASGSPVGIPAATLWKRMHEGNLLLSTERRGGELRLRTRKVIGGLRRPVIHIAAEGRFFRPTQISPAHDGSGVVA